MAPGSATAATLPELGAAVERLLVERGALTREELLSGLTATGLELGRSPMETLHEVLDDDDVAVHALPILGDRWVWLPTVLRGRIFTHRVTDVEVTYDMLAATPDLSLITSLMGSPEFRVLADGGPLQEAVEDDVAEEHGLPAGSLSRGTVLRLAPGRLGRAAVEPGDLVGLRVTDGIELDRLDATEAAAAPDGLGDRLAMLLADRDEPVYLPALLATLCAEDLGLFTEQLPPVADLLEAAPVAVDGDMIAPSGFDFDMWRLDREVAELAEIHGLDEDAALAVIVMTTRYREVVELVDAVEADPDVLDEIYGDGATGESEPSAVDDASSTAATAEDRETMRATVAFLADPSVARAVLGETVGVGDEGAAALGMFAETLERSAPAAARPALRWLQAKALERMGDVADAERMYREAESLDPSWPLPLHDLARYASDRGDAESAVGFLRRAGVETDDPLLQVVTAFRSEPRTDIRRNDRCWCGSGRKYKQCHMRREGRPLDERAGWLYQKAGTHVQEGPWRFSVMAAAERRAEHLDGPYALLDALDDPLVLDAVLFEGGAFHDFVDVRGHLLPDDERLLAEQWSLVERSVFEIEDVRPGSGFTARDVRTGDRHDVQERTASRAIKPRTHYCMRIVPAGETMQVFGGMEPVALADRGRLVELLDEGPGPEELVAFLSRRFAPPVLTNTEHETLTACEATLLVPDTDVLRDGLDETYERVDSGGDESCWHEQVEVDGMPRIRATLRLSGDRLHVETNSEARFERVLSVLRSIAPDARVAEERRRATADLEEAMRRSEPRASGDAPEPFDPNDPEVAAVLDTYIRDYEHNWLDTPIPALDDRTPREAAVDPTRRDDLGRLLDTFPAPDRPGAMSATRLRNALGM